MFTLLEIGSAALALASAQLSQTETAQKYTAAYDACRKKDSSNVAWGHCLADELARQKIRLNAAYRRAAFEEREAGREGVEKSQRAWLAYRNANCAAKTVNGSGAAISQLLCEVEMTIGRTVELETFGRF